MKIFKIIKRLFLIAILVIVILISIEIKKGYDMYKEAITQVPLDTKVQEIKSKKYYTYLNEIPQTYIDALISVEDHRFKDHNGIDLIAIGRAFINDIKEMNFVEGGSTITQQLAKNIYFTQEKKLTRKIAEVFMAFEIEKTLEKDEILELYINTSYYGNGYYTLKEACTGYYHKELNEMTQYESILLAGIPNAPSVYALTNNLELAKQRQKQVIEKMIKYGYLTSKEAEEILSQSTL